jgi:4-hydroxy-tetrahydrodipicolinate synthase
MALLNESAEGVYVIAVTPFAENGDLDLESADRMVDFYLEKGATGLTVLGMMGEAPKLTADESRRLVKRVLLRVDGRVPVVAGVSAPGFAPMRELAESVMGDGAAGVMVAPPATVKTDEQCYAYFEGVAETLGKTPFVLQDFPLGTGVQIATSVILKIVKQIPTCVMVKAEDWPGLAKIAAIRQAGQRGEVRNVAILAGNGALFLPEEIGRGANGAMTGFAFPEMMVNVWKAARTGDMDKAYDIFEPYLPFARYEQQPGIGLSIRKHVLAKRGAIKSATVRRPGPRLSKDDLAEIERLLARQTERLAAHNLLAA